MGTDQDPLKWSVPLALHIGLWDVALMNFFVDFDNPCAFRHEWGHFAAASIAMVACIEEVPEFSGFCSAIPNASCGHPFVVVTGARLHSFNRQFAQCSVLLTTLSTELRHEFAPLLVLKDRNDSFVPEFVGEENLDRGTMLSC